MNAKYKEIFNERLNSGTLTSLKHPIIKSKKYDLLYGIGVNDLNRSDKQSYTKLYQLWMSMLSRCYGNSPKYPTYKDCSVCDEWLTLSNFKLWFDKNYVDGYHLDKDLLIPHNRIYSPDTCCFVPRQLNQLFVDRKKARGEYMIGVSKVNNKYVSSIGKYGKVICIGVFNTELEAHNAWRENKIQYATELANKFYSENKISEKIYKSVINYLNLL